MGKCQIWVSRLFAKGIEQLVQLLRCERGQYLCDEIKVKLHVGQRIVVDELTQRLLGVRGELIEPLELLISILTLLIRLLTCRTKAA